MVGGGYADSYLIPLGTLNQDSTHLAYYSLADVPQNQRTEMGCYGWAGGGTRFHIIARYSTPAGGFYYGMSESGSTNVIVPAASGLFVATRTSPTNQVAYRNGVSLASSPAPSIPLPNVSVYVGGLNAPNRSGLPCGHLRRLRD